MVHDKQQQQQQQQQQRSPPPDTNTDTDATAAAAADITPADVAARLLADATPGAISGVGAGSPNLLLRVRKWRRDGPPPTPPPSPTAAPPTPPPTPSPSEGQSAKTCAQLGPRFAVTTPWKPKQRRTDKCATAAFCTAAGRGPPPCCDSAEVCGESFCGAADGLPGGGSDKGRVTHAHAAAACAARGARLCSLAEVYACETCNTGCKFDTKLVWTSSRALFGGDGGGGSGSSCAPGAFVVENGRAGNGGVAVAQR